MKSQHPGLWSESLRECFPHCGNCSKPVKTFCTRCRLAPSCGDATCWASYWKTSHRSICRESKTPWVALESSLHEAVERAAGATAVESEDEEDSISVDAVLVPSGASRPGDLARFRDFKCELTSEGVFSKECEALLCKTFDWKATQVSPVAGYDDQALLPNAPHRYAVVHDDSALTRIDAIPPRNLLATELLQAPMRGDVLVMKIRGSQGERVATTRREIFEIAWVRGYLARLHASEEAIQAMQHLTSRLRWAHQLSLLVDREDWDWGDEEVE